MTIADATTYHLRNAVRRHIKAMSATLVNAGMPDDIAEQLAEKIRHTVWGCWDTYSPDALRALGVQPPELKHTTLTQNSPDEVSDEKVSQP